MKYKLIAVDIDVEKPDEKSIMMYVAEIIKVAEARNEMSSSVDSQSESVLTPEMQTLGADVCNNYNHRQ